MIAPKAATAPPVTSDTIRNVLVVDDSRAQRLLVTARLRAGSYTLHEAESAEQALEICARHDIDLILSDWIMPGMSGIDFCRALRQRQGDRYIYFILLTSNSEKSAVAQGLEVGADDFLSKPVDPGELNARIMAGARLLRMERELRQNNLLLSDTLKALQTANHALDRDLQEARNLQMSLVRDRTRHFDCSRISLILRPSGHVGGDMVGFFDINDGVTGLYNFDVSGHGVTSALLTARVAGLLSNASGNHNIAIQTGKNGAKGVDPAHVARVMNDLMQNEIQTERYLTLGYAEIDRRTGAVRMVQAGHPHPVLFDRQGHCTLLGSGGLPIGLLPGASYTTVTAQLEPGQNLLLVSDGVTECPNPDGVELGSDGLMEILNRFRGLTGHHLLDSLMWDLAHWHGGEDFPDDVSMALFEYDGPEALLPVG